MKLIPNLPQRIVLEDIKSFSKDKARIRENPVLRIGGIAGGGKTTMMKVLKHEMRLETGRYLALGYTGQSANRMRQAGFQAYTFHSGVMEPKYGKITDKEGKVIDRGGIPRVGLKWDFVKELNENVDFIWIDEGSFTPKRFLDKIIELASDRLIPIVMTGDPLQLPPVIGEQCFHMGNLDHFLDRPMRQALDSLIVKLAMQFRYGEKIDVDKYNYEFRKNRGGNVAFLHQKDSFRKLYKNNSSLFSHSDMIITATNRQRNDVIQEIRKHQFKTDSPYPVKFEKMVCRKNSSSHIVGDLPLTNGTLGYNMSTIMRSNINTRNQLYYMDFQPFDYMGDYFDNLTCDAKFLLDPCGPDKIIDEYNPGLKFEYGHALTTHLAQGSEFPSVAFLDRYTANEEYMQRLRYTAVTRAKNLLLFFI